MIRAAVHSNQRDGASRSDFGLRTARLLLEGKLIATKSSSVLKPHGHVTIVTAEGSCIERDTLRCVHCQHTWVVQPGSGKRRGFCTQCAGPTCGAPQCCDCVPFEKKLELYEAGKLKTL